MTYIPLCLAMFACAFGTGDESFDVSETASLVLGQANFESSNNNSGTSASQASASSLSAPRSIFSDGTRLYMADTNNNRVLIWSIHPTKNNQTADVVIGQANLTANQANQGGTANCATLSGPMGIYVKSDKLFIADTGNNRVLVFNGASTLANGAQANFVIGHGNCTETRPNQLNNTTGGPRSDTLNTPSAVAYDGTNMYIADTHNHRVLIYEGLPAGHAHRAAHVVGQAEMDNNALSAVAANRLNKPRGIYSSGNKLVISDSGNNRVLIYNGIPSNDNLSANVVLGQTDFTTSTAGTSATTLSSPEHIAGDAENKLVIADSGNHRVLVFNGIPGANATAANSVIGQPNATSSQANRGTTPNSNTLNAPHGVAVIGATVWIADTLNHRALRF